MAYPPNFAKASRRYRPLPIKVLFIAEAPPALRFERFFYFVRVNEADTLFLEMMKVLYPIDTGFVEHEDGQMPEFDAKRVRLQKAELLEKFKRDGFYLIDASEQPMPENAGTTAKKHIIRSALPELRSKARELSSEGDAPLVLIGAPTYSVCAEALRRDGMLILNEEMINSPARGGQKLFRRKLGMVLRQFGIQTSDGVSEPPGLEIEQCLCTLPAAERSGSRDNKHDQRGGSRIAARN
jgi:hypothetical protein